MNFAGEQMEGYEDYDNVRLYGSDHYGGLWVDEDGDGIKESNWNWTAFSVLNMINTGKIPQGGDGAYASIPAYCVDVKTGAVQGHKYRRINLEDSTCFDHETVGRVRAIMMNSFPFARDMSAIAAAVNAWLADTDTSDWVPDGDTDFASVVDLKESEVIAATQAAIWNLTNEAEVYNPYLGTGSYITESSLVDLGIFHQPKTEHTKGNITAVYNYLTALESMAAQDPIISTADLRNLDVSYLQEVDGTYTATVHIDVTATMDNETDELALTAVYTPAGDDSTSFSSDVKEVKNGTRTYTLIISGMTRADLLAPDSIKVAVDGHQTASDVFLFDPIDGSDSSQLMAGYDSSTLPVHATITAKLNAFIPTENDDTVDVMGTKIWEDEKDRDKLRPDHIIIELLADGISTGLSQKVVPDADGNWSFKFENLKKYKDMESGDTTLEEIVYTIREIGIEGYTTDIVGNAEEGFVITNTHIPTEDKKSEEDEKHKVDKKFERNQQVSTDKAYTDGTKTENKTLDQAPQTDDNSNMIPCIFLFFLSIVSMIVALIRKETTFL